MLDQLIVSVLTGALGAVGMGLVWLVKTVCKTKYDVRNAFRKLRELETKLENQNAGSTSKGRNGSDSEARL